MMKLREKSSRGKFEPKVPVRRKKKFDAAKRFVIAPLWGRFGRELPLIYCNFCMERINKYEKPDHFVREGEEEGGEATLSSELLKLVKQSQDGSNAQGSRRDVRAPTRVAFGFGSPSSGRETVDFHKGGIDGGKGGGGVREGRTVDKKSLIKSSQGAHECILLEDTPGRKKKESTEPWDYSKYYPMTVPLRPPFSRTTDEQEFGDTAADKVPDENAQPSADELNLRAVPGSECTFAQELAAINPVSKHCCFMGDVTQRVSLIPDIDDLLEGT